MDSQKEKIGIVILNYKTWEKTCSCVESIYRTYPGKKQIVIVDNKSPNKSYTKLCNMYNSDKYPEVSVIQSERNGGFSYGNNFGFDYIRTNYPEINHVILTNNDILFEQGAIDRLIDSFDLFSNTCITAPLVHNVVGGMTNPPWKRRRSILQFMGIKKASDLKIKWKELTCPMKVYEVSGCCLAVDCEKFEAIGKFDENVFLYQEEGILSSKIEKFHYVIAYIPSAKVIHDHGASTGVRNVFVDKELIKSSIYYLKKYENKSFLTLLLVYIFFIVRVYVKFCLRRYNTVHGISRLIRDTYVSLIKY